MFLDSVSGGQQEFNGDLTVRADIPVACVLKVRNGDVYVDGSVSGSIECLEGHVAVAGVIRATAKVSCGGAIYCGALESGAMLSGESLKVTSEHIEIVRSGRGPFHI